MIFYVKKPSSGTTQSCVVFCTDGTKTAEKTVGGITEGSSHIVTLSYWNGELYYAGDEYTSITGGWESFNPTQYTFGTATKNADNLYLYCHSSSEDWTASAFGTVNKIDLTGFTNLTVISTDASGGSGDSITKFGISSVKDRTVHATPVASVTQTTGSVTLDISTFDDEYYVFIECSKRSSGTSTSTTTKIFLS